VLIALDGENAWEHYPFNGFYFLRALYEQLASHPLLELTTLSDCIARVCSPPRSLGCAPAAGCTARSRPGWGSGQEPGVGSAVQRQGATIASCRPIASCRTRAIRRSRAAAGRQLGALRELRLVLVVRGLATPR